MKRTRPDRQKCRNAWCPNTYTEILGGGQAFGLKQGGAVCIPCLYAEQTAAADVVAEFAREMETRKASAGPIAEVPFALEAEPVTRRAVNGGLF